MYSLITVTYGGEVKYSNGYETLAICQQAKSLALTGMTIEQNKVADDAYNTATKSANISVNQGGSGGSGISYRPQDGESISYVRGQLVLKTRYDIKVAECIEVFK